MKANTIISYDFDELNEDSNAADWIYGAHFIHESVWVEYVQQLLADIGDIGDDIPWYIDINWESTANNIKADYDEVGDYLVRA